MTARSLFRAARPAAALLLLPLLAATAPSATPPPGGSGAPRTDDAVAAELERWQDWRFGLLLHWGPYSQWGVVESWTLCSEDEPWCRRPIEDYSEYKRRYEALPMTFDPVRFDPAAWARAARAAGMRYVVFTTKHHDGFCMFDTRTTDYRVTGPQCAFRDDPRANVTRELFDAFRAQGLGIGAYFSKPDWHSDDYWWRNFATPDRNVNYSIARYPERWARFVRFTHEQIEELVRDYGRIDVLWLDGGWVRPLASITPDVASWCKSPEDQDIDVPGIAAMARRYQPGMLIVDRTVHGPYEDVLTPEQTVPDAPLAKPWETCMTMGDQWSYKPADRYKDTRTLIHTLVDVVAKGGNLLLNIGPDPEGRLPAPALGRLAAIGRWMDVNGSAIHGTRAQAPYRQGNVAFTRGKDGRVNAIVLAAEGEEAPPAEVRWTGPVPAAADGVHVLGSDAPVSWRREDEAVVVTLPDALRDHPPCADAWVLAFQPEER